jgi:putative ABC transport system ATP-binding protein
MIVSLENISKRYKRGHERVAVLQGLSLNVPDGDFLALMGPSGSGKSTLLNLIGGLDRPDSGEVVVAGERIDRLSGGKLAAWRAHHVGFVFQFYNLMPMLSAARNVELPLMLTTLSRSERKKRVAAALEIVGLTERSRHKPSQLSGGEQQRVAIARALVSDPAIMVCDEPTGDLDRQTANGIMELLRLLHQRGKTVIMVTHDAMAAAYATHVLHMDKGVLVEAVAGSAVP